MRIGLFILSLTFLCAATLVHGQEPASPKVEIVALSSEGVIRGLQFQTIDGLQELDIYSRGFGPSVEYRGPAELEFFRPLAEDLGFEENRRIVGRVALPAGVSRVMLLFQPQPEAEEETYRIFAFDNSLDRFPAGAYRFFNTASHPVLCQLGSARFELPPHGNRIAEAAGDENGNVTLRMYRKSEAEFDRIYSSVWQVKDTRRTTVFITPSDSRVQEVSIHKFVEPVIQEKEATSPSE